jgi:hypothetical protein
MAWLRWRRASLSETEEMKMSLISFRVASAALLMAIAGACDRAPTSPARTVPQSAALTATSANGAFRWVGEHVYDLTDALVAYPCGDGYTEQIRLEGKVFTRYTLTADGSGGVHSLTQSMPVDLRGIGLTSGAEYRVTEREHGTFNQGWMEQTASTYKSFLDISAPSIHARARLVLGGTFVVNANGELVFERPIVRADCSL